MSSVKDSFQTAPDDVVQIEEDIVEEHDPEGNYQPGSSLRASERAVPLVPVSDDPEPIQANTADKEGRNKGNDYGTPQEEAALEDDLDDPTISAAAPVPVVAYDEDYDVDERPTHQNNNNNNNKDHNRPIQSRDKCCGLSCCGYPNGVGQIVFAQLFLFCGLWLCAASLLDCKFIEATQGYPVPAFPNGNSSASAGWNQVDIFLSNDDESTPQATIDEAVEFWNNQPPTRRGFGFVMNETLEGGCGWNSESRYWIQDEFTNYRDFLGSDWNVPRALAGAATVMGWILLVWSMSMACVSYARPFRWVAFFVIFFLMISFQASAFAIVGSDFCNEMLEWETENPNGGGDDDPFITNVANANCSLSRGAWLAIAGICCYFISALCFCFMVNHVVYE